MNKKGVTVLELLIAMLTGLVILTAAYGLVDIGQKNAVRVGRKVVTQQDGRLVLDYMAMDVRMASFNPGHVRNIWRSEADGNIVPDPTITFTNNCGIRVATASQMLIEMDLNNDGVIGCNCPGGCCGPPNTCTDPTCTGANEYILYLYDGINTITRSSGFGGTNQTMLGGAGSGTIVDNAAAGVSLFRYFNRAGTEILPANLPAQIPAIRRVRITLVIRTEQPSSTNQPVQMTYYTDVLLKNHPLCQYVQ